MAVTLPLLIPSQRISIDGEEFELTEMSAAHMQRYLQLRFDRFQTAQKLMGLARSEPGVTLNRIETYIANEDATVEGVREIVAIVAPLPEFTAAEIQTMAEAAEKAKWDFFRFILCKEDAKQLGDDWLKEHLNYGSRQEHLTEIQDDLNKTAEFLGNWSRLLQAAKL